jgi:porin
MEKILRLSKPVFLLVMVLYWICLCTNAYAQAAPDFNSTKLTGDWGGARTKLAEQGITLDVDAVQSLQKVVGGGKDNKLRYGGSMSYRLKLDFEKMGLWPGAFIDIQAEHQFGTFIGQDTGTILTSNTDGIFPLPNYQKVNVSEFKFTQFLSESFAIFLGKINTLDGDDNIFAGGRGKTNFMNQNFILNPVGIRTVPYSALGIGAAVFLPNVKVKDPAIFSFVMLGPDGQPNTSGFDKDFKKGETFSFAYRQPTRFFGKSGSHTFSGAYGTKNYLMLEQNPRLILKGLIAKNVTFAEKESSWSFMYNMHQYLYTEKEDETQGFGVFARFGTADDKTNPIENFYSVGLGGKGPFDGRDNDTWGFGYFYVQLSDKLGRIIEREFGDSQGYEIFYNIEVTPWLHITPDFQIIKPSNKNTDTAYVAGMRTKIDF